MQVIQHQELGSTSSAITFSSIPQTPFTDLYLLLSVRSTNADDGLFFKFNNTVSNTSWRNLLGYGTGTLSQSGGGWLAAGGVRSPASTFTNVGIYIPNYAGATAKTASVDSVSEENGSTAYQFIVANLWNDTTAIDRIDVYLQGGSLTQYSSATLYGITKGSSGGVIVS
jgi:hypothetical protein